MPAPPEIIDLVHDVLRTAAGLAEVREWNKASGLVTMAAPGCSVGLEDEKFEAYTRELDEATAYLSILIWVKNPDPAAGEAKARALAQEARLALIKNRTLGGGAADSYVHGIRYTTAEGGKSLILHLAEIDFRVRYYSPRAQAEDSIPVEQVDHQVVNE